jgi:hypothetical protein
VELPGTLALASNCDELSAVPWVIVAGAFHVRIGVAFATESCTVAVAED